MKNLKFVLAALLIVSMLICFGCSKDNGKDTTASSQNGEVIVERTDEQGNTITIVSTDKIDNTGEYQTFDPDVDTGSTTGSSGSASTSKSNSPQNPSGTTKSGGSTSTTDLPTHNNTTPIVWFDDMD